MKWKTLGPGLLVTAAFIGPGTLTVASHAGTHYHFSLVWAVLFSVVATVVLQEMAIRFGLVTRLDLASALRIRIKRASLRRVVLAMVLGAVAVGNAAYEGGNIAGAALAMEAMTKIKTKTTAIPQNLWPLMIGALAILLLNSSDSQKITRRLAYMVGVLSAVFLLSMVLVRPDVSAMVAGMRPHIPQGGHFTVIALIGTTVVPYNLFLQSKAVLTTWNPHEDLDRVVIEAKRGNTIAIGLGGLITLAILCTSAMASLDGVAGSGSEQGFVATIAQGLHPVLGHFSEPFLAMGMLMAGITSAVTAPWAAAYVAAGAMNWPFDMRDARMRGVWLSIVVLGTGMSLLGIKPVPVILFAQAANGIVLPLSAVALLIAMNHPSLGRHQNNRWSNIMGGAIVIVVCGLGLFQLAKVFGLVG